MGNNILEKLSPLWVYSLWNKLQFWKSIDEFRDEKLQKIKVGT